ncbi:MAG: hypothetical protein HXX11_10335 [Desulfuromonadales bacterium]|nr:hypothetical protein [Desulfuromonadales bacterium]
MLQDILRWGLIIFLILVSNLVYTEVQGYLAANAAFLAIKAFSAKSKISLAIIFTAFNFIGAIFTAIITALPCGYLARKQSNIIAILILVSTQSIPTYVVFQDSSYELFITLVWIGQILTCAISVFAFSEIGRRIAAKNLNSADV